MSGETLLEQLIDAATDARNKAYARYSGYRVGAALATRTGEVFAGCNVENASYGLTICAERVALGSAVAAGYQAFQQLAIVGEAGIMPCGACRQVLIEFCDDLEIVLVDQAGQQASRVVSLCDLLPASFRLKD